MSEVANITVAPSPELLAFAERDAAAADPISATIAERREKVRLPFTVPAVVQLVDGELNALGEPIAAVTRDMTTDGLGLILDRSVNAGETIEVQFNMGGKDLNMIGDVLWCRSTGPFHVVGVRIVRSLDSNV